MTIDTSKIGVSSILRAVAVVIWGLGAFGSILATHAGIDGSQFSHLLLGLACWSAASVYETWTAPKPPGTP